MKIKKRITFLFIITLVSSLIISLLAPKAYAADISLTFGGSYSPKILSATTACGSADFNLAYIMNTTNSACTIGAVQLYGDTWAVSTGQFIELTVSVYNLTDNNSLDAYFSRLNNASVGTWNGSQWVNNIRLANVDYSQVSASNGLVHYLFEVTSAGTVGGIQIAPIWVELKPNEAVSFVMMALYGYPNYGGGGGSTNIQQVITEVQYFRQEFNTRLNTVITNQELIYQALQNQQQAQQQTIDAINNINDNQQQAGEQAQQDADTNANTAQSDADTNTAPLFTTIGNILGAITDTPAGDCTINGDMGNVNLGNLNFCQGNIGPLRPIIQAVLYLVMALATYKIMIWIIGAIAGLVNWVQTGNEGKEE